MTYELMPQKPRQYGLRLDHGVLLSSICYATTCGCNVLVGKSSYAVFWNETFWFPELFGSGCVTYFGMLVKTPAGRLVSFAILMAAI
jgi:hypothetical protein